MEWEAKLKEITWASGNDHPRFRHGQWREVFEKQLKTTPLTIQKANPLFSLPIGEETFKFTHWLSRDAIWERYRTMSQFTVLDGKQLLVSGQHVTPFCQRYELIPWQGRKAAIQRSNGSFRY